MRISDWSSDVCSSDLPDHVVVQHAADVLRRRHAVARLHQRRLVLFADDVHAELDAFIADEHGRTRDELPHLMLALAAEGAVESILGIAAAGLGHTAIPRTLFLVKPC